MTEFKKNAFAVAVPIETLLMFATGDWRRKIDYTEEIPVPEQEWDDYYDALDDLRSLQGRECWIGYDGDEEYIREPRPRTIFHYAETKEEWEARVWAKLDAGEQPDNQALKFNQDVVDYFFGEPLLADLPRRPANGTYGFKVQSLGGARDWHPDGPSASEVADHVREQARLDIFGKECDE